MKSYKLPHEEMKAIEDGLYNSIEIQRDINQFDPPMLDAALGPESNFRQAWPGITHTAHVLQVARYHLYMAYHEKVYYSKYRDPVDSFTANGMAFFLFTSYSMHLFAAEEHMARSMMLLLNRSKTDARDNRKSWAGFAKKQLKELGDTDCKRFLDAISEDSAVGWLHTFRDRWVHGNPIRVEGLWLQWEADFNTKSSQEDPVSGTLTLPRNVEAPPEITIQEMLEKGRKAFNILAGQFDHYTQRVAEQIRDKWNDGPEKSAPPTRRREVRREPLH